MSGKSALAFSLYPRLQCSASFEESWCRQLEPEVHGANDKTCWYRMLNNKTTSPFLLVTLLPYLLLSLQTARLVPRLPGMKVPNVTLHITFAGMVFHISIQLSFLLRFTVSITYFLVIHWEFFNPWYMGLQLSVE